MNDPLVTVVVPLYNREDCIVDCLNSIVNQTYKNIELIVVDDGSTDNSYNVVEKFQKDIPFDNIGLYSQKNSGAPAARNFGLQKAKGFYIIFFDSDDLMLKERVEWQVQSIMDSQADSCACGFENSETGEKYYPNIDKKKGVIGSLIYWQLMGSTQSWLYRKDYVLKIGGYDIEYECYQDWNLTFRYLINFPSTVLVKKSLSIFFDKDVNGRITTKLKKGRRLENIKRFYLEVLKNFHSSEITDNVRNHVIFLYSRQICLKLYNLPDKNAFKKSIHDFKKTLKKNKNLRFFDRLKLLSYFQYQLFKNIHLKKTV